MDTTGFEAEVKNRHNPGLPSNEDDGITHQVNSISSYPQNEGLSSKDEDFQQTRGTSERQSHYSERDDTYPLSECYSKTIKNQVDSPREAIPDFDLEGFADSSGDEGKNGETYLPICNNAIELRLNEDDTWTIIHKPFLRTISSLLLHR